ncbi:MAG: tetratricopeptide repeat protein, partial [Candidatus Sericytochromatia bacterium]
MSENFNDFYLKSRFHMKKRVVYPLLMSSLLFIPLKTIGGTMNSENNKIYSKAENLYKEHNYKEALDSYSKVITSSASEHTKKDAYLKTIECLIKIKKWDKVIDSFEKYQKIYDDNLFKARLYNLGAEIYLNSPTYGYKKDGKVYRDDSIREGEYVYLDYENKNKASEYFDTAKKYYYKIKEDININKEVITLNFNMADMLQTSYYSIYRDFEFIPQENNNITSTIDENDKKRKTIVFLYDEIIDLNKIVKDSHNNAKALFKKASYFVNTYGGYKDFEQDKDLKKYNPITILEQVVKNYPKDTLAPEALYGLVQINLNQNNKIKALKLAEQLIKDYPQSLRVSDCKGDIQDIKRKTLSLNSLGVQKSDSKTKIEINSRNLKEAKVEVFSIDF